MLSLRRFLIIILLIKGLILQLKKTYFGLRILKMCSKLLYDKKIFLYYINTDAASAQRRRRQCPFYSFCMYMDGTWVIVSGTGELVGSILSYICGVGREMRYCVVIIYPIFAIFDVKSAVQKKFWNRFLLIKVLKLFGFY